MKRLFLLLLWAAPLSSCGYQWGNLYAYKDVQVRIFDNVSNRRIHEFDLTNAIVHEMSARGIRVNRKDAEYTLEGTILDIRTPSVVESDLDQVTVGALRYNVEIRLLDRSGKERFRTRRVESVSFTVARGESEATARAEVFDRLARWVVSRLEKEW